MLSNQTKRVVFIKIVLIGLSFISLLVWYQIPIFPDEIAVRLLSGRYLQDSGISQKLFHYCAANSRDTPALFVIPAWLFSWQDMLFSPINIRVFPWIISIALLSVSISLACRRGYPFAAVIATTALLGVAGSSLVMARFEYVQLLNVLVCFGAIYFIESDSIKGYLLRYSVIAVLLLTVLMSLFVHIQGLLFLPLTLFVIYLLLKGEVSKLGAGVLAGLALLFSAYTTIVFHHFSCTDHPEIAQYMADKVFSIEKINSLGFGKWFVLEFKSYYTSFIYKPDYQINYLPGIIGNNQFMQVMFEALNLGIVIIVLVNFCIFLFVAGYGSTYLFRQATQIYKQQPSDKEDPSADNVITLMLIVMPVLFLFFYDVDHNFYRSFFINFLIAIVLAIVVSWRLGSHASKYSKAYLLLCGTVVFLSALINYSWFADRLNAGFEGPSMSVNQNWESIQRDVKLLAVDCDIDLEGGKIVIDDMTYDSLKSSPNLYPITYLHLSAQLTKLKPIDVIEAIHPNAILARCDSFRSAEIEFTHSRNRLCCLNTTRIAGGRRE